MLVTAQSHQGSVTPPRWLSLKYCVWDGPECLRRIYRLQHIYPSLEKLFLHILQCQLISDFATLIREAQGISETDDLDHVARVFEALIKHRDLNKDAVYPLKDLAIFPTVRGFCSIDNSFDLRKAIDSDEWYIPDDTRLAFGFGESLNVLAFPAASLDEFAPLFDMLDLHHRLLSIAVTYTLAPDGNYWPVLSYERWLRKRVRFVTAYVWVACELALTEMLIQFRLVPNSGPDRDGVSRRLRHIKVFRANSVAATWTVHKKDRSVAHRREEHVAKPVALFFADNVLHVWLTTESPKEDQARMVELASELAIFCGITSAISSALLTKALTETNPSHTEDQFRELGVTVSPADAEGGLDIGP